METSINTRKLAAVNRDNQKEHRRNKLSRHTKVSRVNDEYITPLLEEIGERMTKNCLRSLARQTVKF